MERAHDSRSVPLGLAPAVALLGLAAVGSVPAQAQDRYPVRQLSSETHQEGFPAWSPDGKTLVFENVEPGHYGLFKVGAQGGAPVRFTSFIGEHPKWSPDGQYIVFDAAFGDSIKIVSAHGGRPVRIVPESIHVKNGGNPVWSPDGSRIAFKADSVVWILEIETGVFTKAHDAAGKRPIPSCWSRDGSSIFAWLLDPQSRASAIWRIVPGGEAVEVFTPAEGKSYRYADESPDGSLLALTYCEGRACDLWVARSGGGSAVQLTRHPAYDDTPAWSPDGTKIAFTSARSGKMDVYVMDLDLEDLRAELKALDK
jgi:Tol biopolymer transport system component